MKLLTKADERIKIKEVQLSSNRGRVLSSRRQHRSMRCRDTPAIITPYTAVVTALLRLHPPMVSPVVMRRTLRPRSRPAHTAHTLMHAAAAAAASAQPGEANFSTSGRVTLAHYPLDRWNVCYRYCRLNCDSFVTVVDRPLNFFQTKYCWYSVVVSYFLAAGCSMTGGAAGRAREQFLPPAR